MKILLHFLIFILFYHILMTGLGGFGIEGNALVAGGKDIVRIGIILGIILVGVRSIYKTRGNTAQGIRQLLPKTVRYPIAGLVVLSVLGVLYSYGVGRSMSQIVVGFKYSLRPLVILLGSVLVGLVWNRTGVLPSWLGVKKLGKLLIGVIIVGFVWQAAKVVFPDAFISFGYGPVGDFVVGQAAPIWYRTGPGGAMRRQGVFAGPNNYGYFLTAFASVMMVRCMQLRSHHKKLLSGGVALLFVSAVMMTYSRGAILGVGVQGLILVRWFFPQWKKVLYRLGGVGVVCVVGLSVWKRSSTVLHLQAWIDGVEAIVANPWGYGLGSSGPSVHYEGVYLPENQYLQIALDLGVWGLIMWVGIWGVLWRGVCTSSSVGQNRVFGNKCPSEGRNPSGVAFAGGNNEMYSEEETKDSLSMDPGSSPGGRTIGILIPLLLGGLGLAVIGMFLHVLEDSMVNYRYLSLLGICIGTVLGSTKHGGNQ